MNQRLISEIGRTQRLEIINSLKRTRGMSVNELVEKMKMSYMGIKQHCLTLQRDGYLDTWRRPQKMGRPEMVYRLTRRSHDLFQADSHQLTLDLLKAAQEIYGPNAPENFSTIFLKKGQPRSRVRRRETQSPSAPNGWPMCAMAKVTCPSLLTITRMVGPGLSSAIRRF